MMVNFQCDDLSKQTFDEIEKNSIKLRNIECEHYNASIKLFSEDYFEKIILKISCNFCNNRNHWEYRTKENKLIYSCKKCNNIQISINYVINEEKKIENKSSYKFTNNGDNYFNELNNNKNETKNTKEDNIQINVDYNGNIKNLTFNLRDSFDKQYHKLFEIFGINNKKDLYFNSTKLDVSKTLKDNELYDNCFIEIID